MNGAQKIVDERTRQIQVENFPPANDDSYINGELMRAARCYLEYAEWHHDWKTGAVVSAIEYTPADWPWDLSWWKPVNPTRALEKAGALIAAEIDRLQRVAENELPH
jgi:hypothetical protein